MDSTLFPHCNLLRVKLKYFLICDIFLDAWPWVSSSLTRMKSWTKERFPKIFIIWCPFDFWGLFLSISTSVKDSCYYGNWLLSVQIFLLSLIFFKESTLLFFFYWIKPAIINIAEPEVFYFLNLLVSYLKWCKLKVYPSTLRFQTIQFCSMIKYTMK